MKKETKIVLSVALILIAVLISIPILLSYMDSRAWEAYGSEQKILMDKVRKLFDEVHIFDKEEYMKEAVEEKIDPSFRFRGGFNEKMTALVTSFDTRRQKGPVAVRINCFGRREYARIDGFPVANKLSEAESMITIHIFRESDSVSFKASLGTIDGFFENTFYQKSNTLDYKGVFSDILEHFDYFSEQNDLSMMTMYRWINESLNMDYASGIERLALSNEPLPGDFFDVHFFTGPIILLDMDTESGRKTGLINEHNSKLFWNGRYRIVAEKYEYIDLNNADFYKSPAIALIYAPNNYKAIGAYGPRNTPGISGGFAFRHIYTYWIVDFENGTAYEAKEVTDDSEAPQSIEYYKQYGLMFQRGSKYENPRDVLADILHNR